MSSSASCHDATSRRPCWDGHEFAKLLQEVHELGYKARLGRQALFKDMRPSDATEAELQEVAALREELLQAEGLEAPPQDHLANFYTQAVLLRFLRGRGPAREEALVSLQKTMRWHSGDLLDMLRVHEEQDLPRYKELFRDHFLEGLFGVDRRGVPVSYCRIGLRDMSGLIRESGEDVILRHAVSLLERNSLLLYEVSCRCGARFSDMAGVIDCGDADRARGNANVRMLLKAMEAFLTEHYPEITHVLYVINVPWYFSLFWKIMYPIVPSRTRARIRIYGSDFLEALQEHIDISEIPSFLGGKSEMPWPYGDGGDIPEGAGTKKTAGSSLGERHWRELDYLAVQAEAPSVTHSKQWLHAIVIPAAAAYLVQFVLRLVGCSRVTMHGMAGFSGLMAAVLVIVSPFMPLIRMIFGISVYDAFKFGLFSTGAQQRDPDLDQKLPLQRQRAFAWLTLFSFVMFGTVNFIKTLGFVHPFCSLVILLLGSVASLWVFRHAIWIDQDRPAGPAQHASEKWQADDLDAPMQVHLRCSAASVQEEVDKVVSSGLKPAVLAELEPSKTEGGRMGLPAEPRLRKVDSHKNTERVEMDAPDITVAPVPSPAFALGGIASGPRCLDDLRAGTAALPSAPFTLTARLRPQASNSVQLVAAWCLDRGSGRRGLVQVQGSGVLEYLEHDASGQQSVAGSTAVSLSDGRWHTVSIIRSANGEVLLYADGMIVGNGMIAKLLDANTARPRLWSWPSRRNWLGASFKGEVGPVLAHDVELTPCQVRCLHAGTRSGEEAGTPDVLWVLLQTFGNWPERQSGAQLGSDVLSAYGEYVRDATKDAETLRVLMDDRDWAPVSSLEGVDIYWTDVAILPSRCFKAVIDVRVHGQGVGALCDAFFQSKNRTQWDEFCLAARELEESAPFHTVGARTSMC